MKRQVERQITLKQRETTRERQEEMDTLKTDEMDGHNERQKRIERQRERKKRRHKDIETI